MQKNFNVKCQNEEQGVKICGSNMCKQLSVLCGDKTCKCQDKHKLCMKSEIQQIWRSLKLKGQSHKPILLMLIQWYDTQIKRFQVQREQLQNSIDKNEPVLFDHEKQLYDHLKAGESQKIKPELVVKTLSSLNQVKQFEYKTTLIKMKYFFHVKTIQLNQIIEKINKVKIRCINKDQEIDPNTQFKFNQLLHNQFYEVMNDQTIRLKQQPNKWRFAFILPIVLIDRKLRLSVVQLKDRQFFFGVCQIQDISKINYIDHNIYQNGVLLFCGSPKINYFGKTKGTQRTKDQITVIDQQDIVSVKCLLDTNTIVFTNQSKGTTTEFKIEIDKNLPLYFCISLYHKGNSVKILD